MSLYYTLGVGRELFWYADASFGGFGLDSAWHCALFIQPWVWAALFQIGLWGEAVTHGWDLCVGQGS